jgi:signal transduction histidine kinase
LSDLAREFLAVCFIEGGTILIDAQNNIDSVIVLVKATGIGIAPEIQPKLYSKFATNSCQGMGLGLYISKNIIEKAWRQSMG